MKKFIVLFSTLLILSTVCLCVGCQKQHTHEYTQTIVAPTCTQRGYTEHKCACGESYNDNDVAALGHSWTVTNYHNDATCTANGHEDIACSREGCSETNTRERENSALGHDYEINYAWNKDECTATAVCKRDDSHKVEETVTAIYVKDTDKTCTENEKGHYLAEFADVVVFADQQTEKNSVEIKDTKTGHKYGQTEYMLSENNTKCTAKVTCKNNGCTHSEEETVDTTSEEVSKATCTENKKVQYKATFTNELFNDYVSGPIEIEETASGHTHVPKVVEPTCTEKGYTEYTCSCGDSYKGNYTNALGHDYTISYNWVDNRCTATADCKNDKSHKIEETVIAEYEKDTTATYEANEKGHYKATFTNKIFEAQTTAENSAVKEGSQLVSCIEFKTLTTNGTVVSGEVKSDITSFNFETEIKKVGGAEFAVYNDESCSTETKIDNTVTLEVGENVFYVKQTVENPYKGDNKIFTVTINREYPYYTVSFDTDGGTEISNQSIKHGECATQPNAPVKTAYDFVGWNFDFTKPITSNIVVKAKWTPKATAVFCDVYVVYDEDKPLADVPVRIYKTSGGSLLAIGATDEDGKYTFAFEDVDLKQYTVGLGEYGVVNGKYDETISAVPFGFELITEKVDLNDGATKATIKFKDIRNTFKGSEKTDVPYKRYMYEGDIVTESEDLTLIFDGTVKYKYLVFTPYTDAKGDVENAGSAANGIYKVYFETTLTGVEFKYFYGSYIAGASTDVNGVPNYIASSAGVKPEGYDGDIIYSGGNYIMFELNSKDCKTPRLLYVYSENAGEVTISVERIGDARDIVYASEMVKIVDNVKKYDKPVNTTLTLMPINGTYEPVFNSVDGYYHVGTANGPILLLQLTKANERIADTAITNIPGSMASQLGEGAGQGYFIVKVTSDDGYTVNSYNFYNAILGYTDDNNNTVKGYKDFANSDGVVPVNEQLKLFLDHKSFRSSNEAKPGYAWLVACMYYAPEGGLDLNGNGTENNPYITNIGENTVKTTSTAYLEFTADIDGFYKFTTDKGTIEGISDVTTYTHGGVLYAELKAGVAYNLKITSAENAVVKIAKLDEIRATKDIVDNEDGTKTDNSVGVTAKNPLKLGESSAYTCIQDDAQAPDGIYVKFEALFGDLTVKFSLYGKDAKIKVKYSNSENSVDYESGSEIIIEEDDSVILLITTVDEKVQDGKYLLVIETV